MMPFARSTHNTDSIKIPVLGDVADNKTRLCRSNTPIIRLIWLSPKRR